MKNLIFIIVSLVLTSTLSIGQDYMKILNDQDYTALAQYTNDKVNLEIDRNKSLVSSVKALSAMKEKLDAFRPVKWSSVHKGTSEQNDAKYFIAEVLNAEDGGLRIFFHLEAVGNSKKISSIRIRELLN